MSRPRRGRAAWACAVAWLVATGASCSHHHPPIIRPYAAPTVDVLMAAWHDHQRAFATMNARARATSWVGGDRIRATVLMLVERSGSLRFEAEVSLQGTVAILATDGERFALLDVSHAELRRGPACPANVASLLRIPLAPPDIAAILLGDAAIPAIPAIPVDAPAAAGALARSTWDEERGSEVLSVPRPDGWLRVWIQRSGGAAGTDPRLDLSDWRVIGAAATSSAGKTRWRLRYEDFSMVTVPSDASGGAPRQLAVAQILRFAEGDASFDDGVEIKFKQRSFNAPSPASAFVLEATPGVTTVNVGCE
jgi:hypothetical protein